MSFLKIQKLIRNEDGTVHSGSASIVDTKYDPDHKGGSRHTTREKLGKVVYWPEDNTSKVGIFLSPTRGLIEYNADKDEFREIEANDPRLPHEILFPAPAVHTIFGDAYLLMMFLKQSGLMKIIRAAFPNRAEFQRVLAHISHTILKDGSHIHIDDFLEKSFLSYTLDTVSTETIGSDSPYFHLMGQDNTRLAFFKQFVGHMKKTNPHFGKCCFVDSTPLPNDIRDNPFNALCSHGLAATSVQMRLVLILDDETGLPVWYDILPGNVLDFSTISPLVKDVEESLGITIDDYVLDAGYVVKDLILEINRETPPWKDENGEEHQRTLIARMPAKLGFPYKELYYRTKGFIHDAEFDFTRSGHSYFGVRLEVEIFEKREFAYVYVDKDNATRLHREYKEKHEKEFKDMTREQKNWEAVRQGFFVLVSNKEKRAEEMLDEYFTRTRIECVFKTCKEYLSLLPLAKWTNDTVRGKILSDIISTIILLQARKKMGPAHLSSTKVIGATQSIMCIKGANGIITVEPPKKQARLVYDALKVKVPSVINLKNFIEDVMLMKAIGA